MPDIPDINWSLLMPQLVIVSTLFIVLIFDMFDSISKKVLAWMTIVGSRNCLSRIYPDATSWRSWNHIHTSWRSWN